jgi:hypothetical protein
MDTYKSISDLETLFQLITCEVLGINGEVAAASINVGGSGYHLNDVLTVVQSGGAGATVKVVEVGAGGAVAGIVILNPGTGYEIGSGLLTTVIPSGGTGCILNVLTVIPDPDKIRIGWPPVGAPAWGRTDDVGFIYVSRDDDPYARIRDVKYSNPQPDSQNRAMSYVAVNRINWIFYGPNSSDHALSIWEQILSPEIQEMLDQNNLSIIPNIPLPVRAPEPWVGQWWDRCDFYIRFYEGIVRNADSHFIKSSGVELITDQGIDELIQIS